MASYYEIITPSEAKILTLDQAKSYLRITHNADNADIQDMIDAAVVFLQGFTNLTFSATGFRGFYDGLVCTNRELFPFLPIERAPLLAVTDVASVQTFDATGGLVDIDPAVWSVKLRKQFSRVVFTDTIANDLNLFDDTPWCFVVNFTAGYADCELPAAIKIALKRYVQYLYANRGDCSGDCGEGAIKDIKKQLSGSGLVIRSVY